MKRQLYKRNRSLLTALLCVGLLCMSSTAWAQADLWIRDDAGDNGSEPNPNMGTVWASPDIWITYTVPGTPQSHPIAGATNWVHVRVRNRGNVASSGTEVLHLYWAKASTGLAWPTQWVNYTASMPGCTATLFGDQVGSATIPSIAPNGTWDVVLQWVAPDYTDYSCFADQTHFCLLARIVPGMTFTETWHLESNTRNNNNIAWRNVYLTKLRPGTSDPVAATILVRNVKDDDATMKLRFTVPEHADGTIFDHATVKVVLDDALYAKWQQSGAQGENIEDQGEGSIQLMNADAWIGNIPMEPGETYNAGLSFARTNDDYIGTLDIDMIQEDDGENTGGERFTVDFSDEDSDGLVSDVPDNTIPADEISVYPNPVQTEFTVSSTDKSASYSVRILDAVGREVYRTSFSGDLKINVATFSRGTYYMEMKNVQTGAQAIRQIVVE